MLNGQVITATATATAAMAMSFGLASASQELTSASASYIDSMQIQISSDAFSESEETYERITSQLTTSVLDPVEGELLSYIKLEEDWDGYGGIVPEREVVDSAITFLRDIHRVGINMPKTMLSGSGEVSLYWDNETTHIEIGFEEGGLLSYLVDPGEHVYGEDDYSSLDGVPPRLMASLEEFSGFNQLKAA